MEAYDRAFVASPSPSGWRPSAWAPTSRADLQPGRRRVRPTGRPAAGAPARGAQRRRRGAAPLRVRGRGGARAARARGRVARRPQPRRGPGDAPGPRRALAEARPRAGSTRRCRSRSTPPARRPRRAPRGGAGAARRLALQPRAADVEGAWLAEAGDRAARGRRRRRDGGAGRARWPPSPACASPSRTAIPSGPARSPTSTAPRTAAWPTRPPHRSLDAEVLVSAIGGGRLVDAAGSPACRRSAWRSTSGFRVPSMGRPRARAASGCSTSTACRRRARRAGSLEARLARPSGSCAPASRPRCGRGPSAASRRRSARCRGG
jgi:hypothetical protein